LKPAKLFLPSQPAWIQVRDGHLPQIKKAVAEYAKLNPGSNPAPLEVTVYSHADGFFVLTFSGPVPTYPFVNLVGWLDDPPGVRGVSGAKGWYGAPGSQERYALCPDQSNPWKDTLLGYSTAGRKIEVYQPEGWICQSTKPVALLPEPSISPVRLNALARVPCLINHDSSFGNPTFQITHPPDTDWHL
jgi:hypothetical protein